MPCPTCQHTMHNLGVDNQKVFWCPRCGTLKSEEPNAPDNISTPTLVHQAAGLTKLSLLTADKHNPEWERMLSIRIIAIAEAVGMLQCQKVLKDPINPGGTS